MHMLRSLRSVYFALRLYSIFRLEIAIPNSFASYFHPKIRVIVRDRTTDPSTTFISARSTPVYGETGLINVARAADKLEDFREKLDRLNEQMRGVYTGVNQGLEAVGQHKHESWFPKQLQKWVPDVPPKTEQQQLTESAVPMSYKDAIMRSQSTRDTTA